MVKQVKKLWSADRLTHFSYLLPTCSVSDVFGKSIPNEFPEVETRGHQLIELRLKTTEPVLTWKWHSLASGKYFLQALNIFICQGIRLSLFLAHSHPDTLKHSIACLLACLQVLSLQLRPTRAPNLTLAMTLNWPTQISGHETRQNVGQVNCWHHFQKYASALKCLG